VSIYKNYFIIQITEKLSYYAALHEGLPNVPRPTDVNNSSMRITQGNLMLCPSCEAVKVIENVTIRYSACDFLSMFYSNYDHLVSFLRYSMSKKCRDLEIRVRSFLDCLWFPISVL